MNNYCFCLVSAQTLIVEEEPNIDFGNSIIVDNTFNPAKVSVPGLLNPDAVPIKIDLNCPKSKKKGSSLGPAKNFIPFCEAMIGALPY